MKNDPYKVDEPSLSNVRVLLGSSIHDNKGKNFYIFDFVYSLIVNTTVRRYFTRDSHLLLKYYIKSSEFLQLFDNIV